MNQRKTYFILISSLISVLLLYLLEQHFLVNYYIKTFTKIILFIVVPLFYIRQINRDRVANQLKLKHDKNLKFGIILGILSFAFVLLAYQIFKQYIDFNAIINEMQNKSKITPSNFLLVALYVTFGNSFLEEFFFRGFVFLNLYELGKVKFAYLYSSILFALYHIAIFKTWFSLPLTMLALFGLIIIGLIFNYVDTKSKNLLNSWVIHILADTAIILIGLRLFEMI